MTGRIARPGTGPVRVAAAVVAVLLLCLPGAAATARGSSPATEAPTSVPAAASATPVYAYFYQWFNAASWRRAKLDLPVGGGYSSDDPHLLRRQIGEAKSVGITGFLTSWKSTATLNRRLSLLTRVARSEKFDLGVVYEALDFQREPLSVTTVRNDMVELVERWGDAVRSSRFGRPVIIWTGTDRYSVADVRAVRSALGNRAYLLSAAKNVSGYERVADIVDGEAYYWSSANPTSPNTAAKLRAMGAAVGRHHGIWIAPATSGFDGRSLNHTRVIGRAGGATLRHSLDTAFASSPSAVGVISWNEWSENTYIEPSKRYGLQELDVLRTYLREHDRTVPAPTPAALRSAADPTDWSGLMAAVALGAVTCIGVLFMTWLGRRRARSRHALGT
jgi:hypothetical protein